MLQNADFFQAAGECFSEAICPPASYQDVSSHECCEVLWQQLGDNFTSATIAALSKKQKMALACAFAIYFECEAPSLEQIATAIERTLARWPPDKVS